MSEFLWAIAGLSAGFLFGMFLFSVLKAGKCSDCTLKRVSSVYEIPIPKFNVGDEVYNSWIGKSFIVRNCLYSVVMKKWYYYDGGKQFNKCNHAEDNLKGI